MRQSHTIATRAASTSNTRSATAPAEAGFWPVTSRSLTAVCGWKFAALLVQAVTLGYGVSVLPAYLCAGALADRQLVSIWDPPEPVTNDLLLAYRKSARMRVEITRAIACMAAGLS